MLIDTHCHLDFSDFDDDRESMFARAHAEGVSHFVVPGTTRERWPAVLELGNRDDVSVCLGMHPYFMDEHDEAGLTALEEALEHHSSVVAIGECGIDARFETTLDAQWKLFDAQLRLAKKHQLPVVVHCVHANDKVAKRLKQIDLPAGGLIHAFAGSPQQAARFLDLGYLVGLGGGVTYERAQRLHRAVKSLPDDGFVLESDAPDMPLAGYQGQRNEPARLPLICDTVAELRCQSSARIAELAAQNARQMFSFE
ncbi:MULTISPECIES: TatD family hydrolase [Halomonadaceae]|uniref:TatD family hydrolase n=1 Tax=Halomonadaceae TaxID=28256 RepID=UPI00159824ED|nr:MULTISPECIES: TatD family hydrolase [Halomonas]QJQ96684.1 TatD family hydrolase [Halomonas sp. PA5]